MLRCHLWGLLDAVAQGLVHMQHPEQSFSTQEHLVKPWNKLQAALSHAVFLKGAPDDSSVLDLEKEIALKMRSFEQCFKERVLQPLAVLFDMRDYIDAEGDAHDKGGFKWVVVFVMKLQRRLQHLHCVSPAPALHHIFCSRGACVCGNVPVFCL